MYVVLVSYMSITEHFYYEFLYGVIKTLRLTGANNWYPFVVFI